MTALPPKQVPLLLPLLSSRAALAVCVPSPYLAQAQAAAP